MVTYAGYTTWAVDSSGDVIVSPAFEVRHKSDNSIASVYSDNTGTALTNPGTGGTDGKVEFYAIPGSYTLTVGSGASQVVAQVELADASVNTFFGPRSDLVTLVAGGDLVAADGDVWSDGTRHWIAESGATDISDLGGWVPGGTPEPFHWSDTPDVTAIQAMHTYSEGHGVPWKMEGTFTAGAEIFARSSGDASGATFTGSSNGETDAIFTIAHLAADRTDSDATLLTTINTAITAGHWKKGVSQIATLGTYEDEVLRFVSSTDYIARSGGDNYRHEVWVHVVDSDGRFYPPLPYDCATAMTRADRIVVRDPLDIKIPKVNVTSGASERSGGLIKIDCPLARVYGNGAENTSGTTIANMVDINTLAPQLHGLRAFGAGTNTSNYGFKDAAWGAVLVDCATGDGRGGYDNTYGGATRIIRGEYLDGIRAHLGFGIDVDGAVVGTDSSNRAFTWSGGDFAARNCKVTMKGAGTKLFTTRSDVPECIGSVRLHDNEVLVDLRGETGSPNVLLMDFQFAGSSFDTGRNIALPDFLSMRGNRIHILNDSGVTPVVYLLRIDDAHSNINGRTIAAEVEAFFAENIITQENGSLDIRIQFTKTTDYTGGGFDIRVADLPDLNVDWDDTNAGAATTTARTRFDFERIEYLDLDIDYGAVERIRAVSIDDYDQTTGAAPTANGDEEFLPELTGHAIDAGGVVRGTGSNGAYIMFPSGEMTCHHDLDLGSVVANGSGTFAAPYRTNPADWTFPQAFNAAPTCVGTAAVDSGGALRNHVSIFMRQTTTTIADDVIGARCTDNATDDDVTAHLVAHGRWR
jgi:hypothetical protein